MMKGYHPLLIIILGVLVGLNGSCQGTLLSWGYQVPNDFHALNWLTANELSYEASSNSISIDTVWVSNSTDSSSSGSAYEFLGEQVGVFLFDFDEKLGEAWFVAGKQFKELDTTLFQLSNETLTPKILTSLDFSSYPFYNNYARIELISLKYDPQGDFFYGLLVDIRYGNTWFTKISTSGTLQQVWTQVLNPYGGAPVMTASAYSSETGLFVFDSNAGCFSTFNVSDSTGTLSRLCPQVQMYDGIGTIYGLHFYSNSSDNAGDIRVLLLAQISNITPLGLYSVLLSNRGTEVVDMQPIFDIWVGFSQSTIADYYATLFTPVHPITGVLSLSEMYYCFVASKIATQPIGCLSIESSGNTVTPLFHTTLDTSSTISGLFAFPG